MTEPAWIAIGINVLVLIAGFIAVSVRTTWLVGEIKADIVKSIHDHGQEDIAEFAKIRQEIDDTARAFGETAAALRQKVVDVELNAEKTYVRRDGYWKAHEQLLQAMAEMRKEIREDFKNLEGKINNQHS